MIETTHSFRFATETEVVPPTLGLSKRARFQSLSIDNRSINVAPIVSATLCIARSNEPRRVGCRAVIRLRLAGTGIVLVTVDPATNSVT